MKRKFLSLVLAICLVIPAMFVLSACGKTEIVTTVTEEQWGKAVNFEGMNNITLSSTVSTNSNFSHLVKYDGVTIYSKQLGMNNDPTSTNYDEMYYTKVTSADSVSYIKYSKQEVAGSWTKNNSDEEEYNNALAQLKSIGLGFPFNQYTYDEKTKAYVHTEVSPAQTNELYFENGKLVKIVIIRGESAMISNLSYSHVSLTLPTVE